MTQWAMEAQPPVALPQRRIRKSTLLLVTLFLGGLGGHKFYLRRYLQGTLYLLFCWFFLLPLLISLVEFVVYAFTSEDKLNERYGKDFNAPRSTLSNAAALTAILAAVGVVAFVAYAGYTERSAKHRATEFCASVKIGDNADPLLERARASGADERQTRWIAPPNEDRWLAVTFAGATPLSRHICSIKATRTVTSAEYVYLD